MVSGSCLFVVVWAWGFNVFACFVCGLLCDGVWCGAFCFVCPCVFYALACDALCDAVWFVCCVSVCVRLFIWLCDILCEVVLLGFVLCMCVGVCVRIGVCVLFVICCVMLYGMVASLVLCGCECVCFCCSKCVCFVCKLLCDIVWSMFGVFLCLWMVVCVMLVNAFVCCV